MLLVILLAIAPLDAQQKVDTLDGIITPRLEGLKHPDTNRKPVDWAEKGFSPDQAFAQKLMEDVVFVRFSITDRKISNIRVSGDPLLSDEARRNVITWEPSTSTLGDFFVYYHFSLVSPKSITSKPKQNFFRHILSKFGRAKKNTNICVCCNDPWFASYDQNKPRWEVKNVPFHGIHTVDVYVVGERECTQ